MRWDLDAWGALAMAAVVVACVPSYENVSYSRDLQPILTKKCSGCHAPGRQGFAVSGLDTTNYEGLMRASVGGELVKRGGAFTTEHNLLFSGDSHGRKRLSFAEVAMLRVWLCEGANRN